MKKAAWLRMLVAYIILVAVLVSPFIPGVYDPLSLSLAASVQLLSGIGLLTCIPGAIWLFHIARYAKAMDGHKDHFKRHQFWLPL